MVVAAVVPAHSEDLSMPHQPLRLPAYVPIAPISARGPSSEGMTHVGRRYRRNAYTSVQPRERRINRWQIASAACGPGTAGGACHVAGSGGLGCQRAPGSAVSSTTSVQGVENLIVATTDDEGLCSNHRSGVLPTSLRFMSEAPEPVSKVGGVESCKPSNLRSSRPGITWDFMCRGLDFAADHETAKSCRCGLDRRRRGGRLGRAHHRMDRHRLLLLRAPPAAPPPPPALLLPPPAPLQPYLQPPRFPRRKLRS